MNTPASAPQATARDSRWQAVCARDASADGRFVYAVRTTGVYCRPSCSARRPLRENVSFHASSADAQRAGFRACKRCKPDALPSTERAAQQVTAMCRRIEQSEQPPTLAALAHSVGMSPFHAQRTFKAITGVTPRAYAALRRSERVQRAIADGVPVTRAVHDAGYGSASRFYAEAGARIGMTPTQLQQRGDAQHIRFAVGQCSLGAILVAATERGVCSIALGDDPEPLVRELQRRFARAELIGGDAEFERWVAQAIALVETPRAASTLPLDIRGTAFQQRVWEALRRIPAGQTRTYAQLATAIGAQSAVRAVASACAANTLAIAIPCHRVVRSDGSLSGYRWGVERKRALLLREQAARPTRSHT